MSNNIWALIVTHNPTDEEPDIRNIDADELPALLGGPVTTVHGHRHSDGSPSNTPRISFHIATEQQQPPHRVNWIAASMHRYYNHHRPAATDLLRGATVIITGHDTATGTAIDLPEDVIDAYIATAVDHLAPTA